MRGAALALAVLLTACTGQAEVVRLGKVDLPVAAGDRLAPCPNASPNSVCVLSPASDPTEPYMHALTERGWLPAHEAEQTLLLRWISPFKQGETGACIAMTPQADAKPGEAAILEFKTYPQGSADNLACAPAS